VNREILLETEISGTKISVIADRISFRLEGHADADSTVRGLMDLHQHSFYELFYVPHDSITIVTESETAIYNEKAVIIPDCWSGIHPHGKTVSFIREYQCPYGFFLLKTVSNAAKMFMRYIEK
jgi:hypothetical protein